MRILSLWDFLRVQVTVVRWVQFPVLHTVFSLVICFILSISSVQCLVAQLCLTLCDPMDSSPPSSSVHGDSPGKNTAGGLPCPPPGHLPNPAIEPSSPTLRADSSPSEPPGKPKNTGVCSLSLLHGNFLTQELNRGLLHCWQILYQRSYLGRPSIVYMAF